jgi:hypothetical protein
MKYDIPYDIPKVHYSDTNKRTLCGLKVKKNPGSRHHPFTPDIALLGRQVTCKKCRDILNKE